MTDRRFSNEYPVVNDDAPLVMFSCDGGANIVLPAPGNLTWSDGHSFSTFASTSTYGGQVRNAAEFAGRALYGGEGNAERKALMDLEAGLGRAGRLAAGGAFGEGIAGVAFAGTAQSAINPQTKTLYSGSEPRSFTFSFNLVPRSAWESNEISWIHQEFRSYSYPKVAEGFNNVVLDYPEVWNIEFDNIKDPPIILPSFLTSMETTFNPSTTMWRADNSPVEVALSVTFTETTNATRDSLSGF